MLLADFSSWLVLGLWIIVPQITVIETKPSWWDRTTSSTTYKPNPNSKLTASYFFPYVCSVVYLDKDFKDGYKKNATWVSSCTILTQHWVATSADNFNFRTPDHKYFYYHDVGSLQVNAGTIFGTPSPTAKGLRNLQKLDVAVFATLLDTGFIKGNSSGVFTISGTPDLKKNMNRVVKQTSLKTFQWNVAFLKLTGGFTWSPQVLPAPHIAADQATLTSKVKHFIRRLERMEGNENCILAGWNRFTHRLGFYTVNYIPMNMCQSAFCTFDTRSCLNFPDPDMHVCFKSIDYGSDACPEDRGSALYCDQFGQSVLGIITTAPNCGLKNLPGVYTRIDRVIHAFRETGLAETVQNLPESELNRYTLPPNELET